MFKRFLIENVFDPTAHYYLLTPECEVLAEGTIDSFETALEKYVDIKKYNNIDDSDVNDEVQLGDNPFEGYVTFYSTDNTINLGTVIFSLSKSVKI